MTQPDVQAVRKAISLALRKHGEQHGVSMEILMSEPQMDSTSATFQIMLRDCSKTMPASQMSFYKNCSLYGLTADDYKAKVLVEGRLLELWDINPRSELSPILARELSTGKIFSFPAGITMERAD